MIKKIKDKTKTIIKRPNPIGKQSFGAGNTCYFIFSYDNEHCAYGIHAHIS